MIWKCGKFNLEFAHTLTMAIVNVTPDSFSDGGMYFRPSEALARARNCVRKGADVLDLGGESTRPGAEPLAWEAEWERLEPALDLILASPECTKVPVSVDTYHAETARRAVALGASVVNCVHEPAEDIWNLARETGCGLVVPLRETEGAAFEAFAARRAGIEAQVAVDPEIGFGTTREEDLALLGGLRRLASVAPVCVGVSRKRLIKKLVGEKARGKNLGGSLGAAVWSAMNGASIVRVHDVLETVQALRVAEAFS